MTLKKLYSWLHLWLGLVVGLIFSVAALTGVMLLFEEELEELVYPDLYFHPAATSNTHARLPLDSLFSLAKRYGGNKKVLRVNIREKRETENFIFETEGDRLHRCFLGIDPYRGTLEAKISGRKHFFSVIEEVHRQLFMGKVGKAITGGCCLSYLVILLTGLILWWPKNKKMWKQRLNIKWDAKGKRLNWDIHAVGGFYAFPILFIVAFTGLTWSYTWFNDGIYYLFDGKGPKKQQTYFALSSHPRDVGVIEKIYEHAQQLLPYRGELSLRLPSKKQDVIEVSKRQADASVPNVVDRLFFSRYTGELVHRELYDQQTLGMKVRRLIFPVHTGSIGGWFTKVCYLIAVLFAASLPYTGLFIWLGRKKKKRKGSAKAIKVKVA